MTNFLLDLYGDDQGLAFDIGCSHTATIQNSKLLLDKANQRRLQMLVNAFHGWAHNRLCQLSFHPLYRRGLGIEDLETLERVFSSSNSIARTIRHATQFHWLQAIDLHFRQWDDEKYFELSQYFITCYLIWAVT
jgi:hypothetical protein